MKALQLSARCNALLKYQKKNKVMGKNMDNIIKEEQFILKA